MRLTIEFDRDYAGRIPIVGLGLAGLVKRTGRGVDDYLHSRDAGLIFIENGPWMAPRRWPAGLGQSPPGSGVRMILRLIQ